MWPLRKLKPVRLPMSSLLTVGIAPTVSVPTRTPFTANAKLLAADAKASFVVAPVVYEVLIAATAEPAVTTTPSMVLEANRVVMRLFVVPSLADVASETAAEVVGLFVDASNTNVPSLWLYQGANIGATMLA